MIVFKSSYRVHFVFHLRKDIGIDIWINNGKFTLHIIITVEQTANLENKREQNENVNYPTKKNSLIRNALSTIIFEDKTIIFLILIWNMTFINCILLPSVKWRFWFEWIYYEEISVCTSIKPYLSTFVVRNQIFESGNQKCRIIKIQYVMINDISIHS